MQKRIASLLTSIVFGVMALALGWFAHAALPLQAQVIVVDGRAALSEPAVPTGPRPPAASAVAVPPRMDGVQDAGAVLSAAPAGTAARLTYQGRLTNSGGAPINSAVSMTFRIYTDTPNIAIWASAARNVTPTNGLFTVYLGDGADPNLDFNVLRRAASIGVTVGGDAEMTPRQPLNTLVGHTDTSTGVSGSSNTGAGVRGESTASDGVIGATGNISSAGVLALGAGAAGNALEINSGGIKATGAGLGTNTFAFIHVSSDANRAANFTRIDNALTNGDQNAMLFVTHVFNPTGVTDNFFDKAFGVYYAGSAAKWAIITEDGTVFPADISFNVMVIKR